MSLASLIQTHGYWLIFVGTLMEGETVLVLGGVAAHRGYLDLAFVMIAAFAGSLFSDQLFFFLGRRHGAAVLARRPGWRDRVVRVDELVGRYDALFIIGFRFLYGLRTVTPFVIGMTSSVRVGRFLLLNVVGAAIWAVVVGGAGFLLGSAVEAFIGRARVYEGLLFAAVASVGIAAWLFHFARSIRSRGRDES
jgi:membrane protein DedA with SNARE-associated domain